MAYDPKISWSLVQTMMDAAGTALNSGYLRIYDNSGAVPTNADDANGDNVLLAQLALAADAFGACSGSGVITAAAITADSSANASGTAAYGRYYLSNGTTCVFQGLCGTATSDFILNSLDVAETANVSCSAATLTMPRE